MTNKEIWQAVLGEVELAISPASFTTWFRNTAILDFEGNCVVISVPNGFAKEWLENKYNQYILRALKGFKEDIKSVRCIVSTSQKALPQREVDSVSTLPKNSLVDLREGAPASRPGDIGQINLNPRYNFENFIVGSNNELAHAACLAVSQKLGRTYNPLFIYGGVGLGKTHLLQSIGNSILNEDPSRKLLYSTSERFTDDLVDRIKTKNIRDFKKPYLDVDLLIIDDIQFIAGKEKTQEEFFHIFNTLYQLNKQIVLSSDRPPKAIATLEERLRSRFEGGMIADVSRPDLETRIAILQHKAAIRDFEIGNEVLNYIASNIQHNIRELEGALSRVMVSCELKQIEPTLPNVKKILSDIIHSGRKKGVNFKQIIQAVADFYDVNTQDLINRSRRKDIVRPRQIAMFLMREELQASFPGIGSQLGGRDHSTAMHSYEKIRQEIEQSDTLEQEINSIKNKIYNQG
ncbi:MAG: chromosomal replication initiator protein DnaA [Candidatus Moranbacteria bacterium]|nr:chromosomal replication initiator protein DnaA [Candidatus Moranbacteria bacterium]